MNKTEQAQQLRLAAELIETGHPWEYSPDGFSWRLSEGACPMYAISKGYEIRPVLATPPFKLPPAPPGMKWHREDGWEEGDLPEGYRPFVHGELIQAGDEVRNKHLHKSRFVKASGSVGYKAGEAFPGMIGRTTRPLTFTHEGKQWTYHRPGDPMPCDGEREIFILCRDLIDRTRQFSPSEVRWSQLNNADIIGWRYVETTKQVPLDPEDVPPGSVFRNAADHAISHWLAVGAFDYAGVYLGRDGYFTFSECFKDWQINRSIPLTGKWDAAAWQPCSKEVQA